MAQSSTSSDIQAELKPLMDKEYEGSLLIELNRAKVGGLKTDSLIAMLSDLGSTYITKDVLKVIKKKERGDAIDTDERDSLEKAV